MLISYTLFLEEKLEELIEKAKKGDTEAYVMLIQLIEKDLYCIASVKLNNIEDINDAIQETMLNSFKNIQKLKDSKAFKSWIIKILLNECKKIYARKYKIKTLFEKLIKTEDTSKYNDDIRDVEGKIDFDIIIKQLNDDDQLIITLYYLKDFSITEISDILNIKYNTVKTKILRAKEKIRDIVEKEDENG